MLSFELKGDMAGVRRFIEALKVFTLAESLGGIESLVAHPATMTHATMSSEARRVAGIPLASVANSTAERFRRPNNQEGTMDQGSHEGGNRPGFFSPRANKGA